MNHKHRILIVDGQALFRAGIRALLAEHANFEIAGEASNGRDALHMAARMQPHLILMDALMPGMNGAETTTFIKRRHPEIRVLILTAHGRDDYLHACLKAGANGYLLKGATREELNVAMRSVLKGKTYLSPDISANVVNGYIKEATPETPPSCSWDALTHRERQVLKLIAEGHPNKFVASISRSASRPSKSTAPTS